MPLVFFPGMRKVPTSTQEWDTFLRDVEVVPDDASTGTDQIENDSVTNPKLRNSEALSVIGRASNSTGDPADIKALSDNTFCVRRGTALGFGPIVDADIPSTIARDSEVSAAVTAHEAAANPHPTYLTQAEGDALYQPLAAVLSMIRTGTGSPEGVVTATVGNLFLRSDGGASTTLYVKESGTGNTGWVAK